jgi:hypothetical protein
MSTSRTSRSSSQRLHTVLLVRILIQCLAQMPGMTGRELWATPALDAAALRAALPRPWVAAQQFESTPTPPVEIDPAAIRASRRGSTVRPMEAMARATSERVAITPRGPSPPKKDRASLTKKGRQKPRMPTTSRRLRLRAETLRGRWSSGSTEQALRTKTCSASRFREARRRRGVSSLEANSHGGQSETVRSDERALQRIAG